MKNTTNLTDEVFEKMRTTLSPEAFRVFLETQPTKKEGVVLKELDEAAWEREYASSKSLPEIFDLNGHCTFNLEINGQDLHGFLFERQAGYVYWRADDQNVYVGGYHLSKDGSSNTYLAFNKPVIDNREEAERLVKAQAATIKF